MYDKLLLLIYYRFAIMQTEKNGNFTVWKEMQVERLTDKKGVESATKCSSLSGYLVGSAAAQRLINPPSCSKTRPFLFGA